ncbi:hypothetical protein I7I51_05167 [Histoplasma capsulatum]|uniref:Non-reducing polyketide synthase nscA n=1 Tax=Ajellomyces capsulatus TaxID=5037 RepID=A0A8A1M2R7_AJECA|nr:hypothetical protein I7I51_05167 [Histoplasma capsulatum]
MKVFCFSESTYFKNAADDLIDAGSPYLKFNFWLVGGLIISRVSQMTRDTVAEVSYRLSGDVSGMCHVGILEMPHALILSGNCALIAAADGPPYRRTVLEDIGIFDAPFFNLTKHEAESLDPEQRVIFERTCEALENGGITLKSLAGEQVGIFVGTSLSDYDLNNYKDSENISRYHATAFALSLQSNRISCHFNFKGPSMSIDTACSSSLTALLVACQSIRSGGSTCAIGGRSSQASLWQPACTALQIALTNFLCSWGVHPVSVVGHSSGEIAAAYTAAIEVRFVGLNYKDIMVAMGQLQYGHLGNECSGIVVAVGDEVADFQVGDRDCVVSEGAFANYSRVRGTSAWKIPGQLSLKVATSIPIAFCTPFYFLFEVGRLQPGERILIHTAAVILAKPISAEIFATVGSVSEKKFLIETHDIDENRKFFSRDSPSAEGIRKATNGRLAMTHFDRNVGFAYVELTLPANKRPQLVKKMLFGVVKMFDLGAAKPISPITCFSISNFEEACHCSKTGRRHIVRTHELKRIRCCRETQSCWSLENPPRILGLNCNLDFFIILSSIANLVGNRGQEAYAAGGTFMSAFGHYRNATSHTLQSMTVKKNSGRPLGTKVSVMMMKSVDEIDRSKPLGAYGLDSLITIEVRNWIFREIQAGLQIMEILVAKFDPQFWTKMARIDEQIGLDLENKLKLTTQLPSNQ